MSMTYSAVFARNMRAARAAANLGQPTVSARMKSLGLSSWNASKVSACERGLRAVTVAELLPLALCLETTIGDLVSPEARDNAVQIRPGLVLPVERVARLAQNIPDPTLQWRGEEFGIVYEGYTNLTGASALSGHARHHGES